MTEKKGNRKRRKKWIERERKNESKDVRNKKQKKDILTFLIIFLNDSQAEQTKLYSHFWFE